MIARQSRTTLALQRNLHMMRQRVIGNSTGSWSESLYEWSAAVRSLARVFSAQRQVRGFSRVHILSYSTRKLNRTRHPR